MASRAVEVVADQHGSINLAPLVYDTNGNGLPNYKDVLLFNVSTHGRHAQPWVNLRCYQNGVQVLNAWNGYFDGALNYNWNFGLASGAWQEWSRRLHGISRHGQWQERLDTARLDELPRRRVTV